MAAEKKQNKDPPISEVFRGFAGDGAPIVQMNCLQDADKHGRWKCNIPLCGVFHFFMAAFKRGNAAHEELIRYLLGMVEGKNGNEATDNNMKYFLDFGDPSGPEKKMGSSLHAIYDHAIREMKKIGIQTTTAASVWKFMRAAGEKKPLALHLLNLVIFWELALLVRQCERNNDADGFFETIPLFLPLFASTHGTKYMKICCDLIKYWATCSELEKELIRKYGFTLETGTGIRVGLDFAFEKYVNLIRSTTGKIYSRGHDALAEYSSALNVMNLSREQDFKKQINPNNQRVQRLKPRKRLLTTDARTYILVTKQLEEIRIFQQSEGTVSNVFSSPFKSDCVLDHQLLNLLSLGEERAYGYFQHNYVDPRTPEPKLVAIPSTVEERQKRGKQLEVLFTSINKKEVNDASSKATLIQQIQMVRDHWPSNDKEKKPTAKLPAAKKQLLSVLIAERKRLFNLDT